MQTLCLCSAITDQTTCHNCENCFWPPSGGPCQYGMKSTSPTQSPVETDTPWIYVSLLIIFSIILCMINLRK